MHIISNFKKGSDIVKNYLPKVSNMPGVYFMYDKNKTILYIARQKAFLNELVRMLIKKICQLESKEWSLILIQLTI